MSNTTTGNGARAALPIWIDFMKAIQADSTTLYFDIPDNMRKIWMDPVTGRAANGGGDGAVKALFVSGTEPN